MQVKLERVDEVQAKTMDIVADITLLSGISTKCEKELDECMVPTHTHTHPHQHQHTLSLSRSLSRITNPAMLQMSFQLTQT
jgi:hypothetical protein